MPKNPLARMFIYGAIATAILLAVALSIDWFPQQGSTSAGKIDTLYDVLLVASVPIFVLVMTVAIYSVIRFRAKPGDTGDGAPIHGNARLEVAWVTLPFLLVTGLAIYAWITLNDIEKKQKGEMVVRVWGRQFAWSFGYTAPNGRYVASDQLYLPVDKPVKFLIRTRDVIHSFWIPDFRLQADAVPGITTDWRTTPTRLGLHDVVCVELCGQGHALMRSTARVVSDQTFTAWITRQSGGAATAVAGAGGRGAKTATAAAGMQLFAA
ncbi:MAG: cytochrome c oxidase subunit II, partial [Actinobacteria bacterium]|nr:cytochrome c oxidase subunit II [Actinomycetota bacterium]